MPIAKPVVFISSTSKDLAAHRDAAARAARQAGFEDVRMEDFEARSRKPPYAACMEKVRECDVLVVIVAHRYGWVPEDQPDKQAKSITWLECEEMLHLAKEKPSKEVLAFVVDPDYKWPLEFKEAYRGRRGARKDEAPNSRRRESMSRLLEEAVTAFPQCRSHYAPAILYRCCQAARFRGSLHRRIGP
ncbi:MAG: DUF4062 domain-containing protein [Bryobacteraceae bacterium]|jgi:Domain of unknown function (DUF4062)